MIVYCAWPPKLKNIIPCYRLPEYITLYQGQEIQACELLYHHDVIRFENNGNKKNKLNKNTNRDK